jgi:uncharacterized membrane protein YhaH (DUF805 family)
MNWYFKVLKKYADFSGRATRQEYWMFVLINFIISSALSVLAGVLEKNTGVLHLIPTLYSLAVLCPAISVGVRRMHDTDRSGWWILFPIVNLIFLIQETQRGDNRFGPNPNDNNPSRS